MSELKEYYDHHVNKKQINVTPYIMEKIEEGSNKKWSMKPKRASKRLVLMIATLVVTFSLGCTFLYQMTFHDTDGNPWTVEFLKSSQIAKKEEKLFDKAIEGQGNLGDGEQFISYYNDGDPDSFVINHMLGYVEPENEELDYLSGNLLTQEYFGITFPEMINGFDFVSFNGFDPGMTEEMTEFIRETTPVKEAMSILVRSDGSLEFDSSDESLNFDDLDIPELFETEPNKYISTEYRSDEGILRLNVNDTGFNNIYEIDQENGIVNDSIDLNGVEVWRASGSGVYQLAVLMDNVIYELELSHGGSRNEEQLNQTFIDLFLTK